ncbi:MAG: TPM domain-containing protein [Myxococcales bacterium]
MRLDRSLDGAARERISAAVRAAEAGSEGQIVPVVVARSIGHSEALYRAGLAGAALATLALWLARPGAALRAVVFCQALGLVTGALLASIPAVERLLLGKRALAQAAWERAERAFLHHHLDRTEKRAGVLIFASLFERQAVVLGDEGIHARMGDEGWRQTVAALVQGLRSGQLADGFCAAIALCGERLARHFPRRGPRKENELPDELPDDRS